MTAAWLWARAELRGRWRSWLVLGLLAGATAGIVAAGVAGARRTEGAVPRYIETVGAVHAAVLPNDPSFDAEQQAAVAALPEVRGAYSFIVPFGVEVISPRGIDSPLLPVTADGARLLESPIVEGRHTNPTRAEAVIDENIAEQSGLGIGDTITVAQQVPDDISQIPPDLIPPNLGSFRQRMRIVGILKSTGSDAIWSPSVALATEHADQIVGITNMFVALRTGEAEFAQFQRAVQQTLGQPVNVERASDLFGYRKIIGVTAVERDGLLLFALAALLGGGVLVGQALVRAVNASGADLDTWRAMGADRPLAVGGMVLPSLLTALVGAGTAVVVAVAVSSQFPIGVARRYELDIGVHFDGAVIGLTVLGVLLAVVGAAAAAAWWRVTRGETARPVTSTAARWAANVGLPPAMLIGSRLAVEPGRGRRAVPVRSALVGAIVGVLGVVACFTFRAGIEDAASNPVRSGVVWDYVVANGPGTVPADLRDTIAEDPDASGVLRAVWSRAVPVDDVPVPVFGTKALHGDIPLVVLTGRAPRAPTEIAMAPTTLAALGLQVGQEVSVGENEVPTRIVGTALLPPSSHTDYDQGAWMTLGGMRGALGPGAVQERPNDFEDYLLIRWRDGTDVAAAERRMSELAAQGDFFAVPAELPTTVADLEELASLPLVLAVFFALLGAATVAHALVTTVRRRRFDLAVLRSIGFTRRQSRLSIAWQATLLAAVGLLVGVPLGIVVGRVIWRWVADDFPLVYVPPIEVIAVLLVVPIVLLVAQGLAAGPAHAATRIRPAQTLRTE